MGDWWKCQAQQGVAATQPALSPVVAQALQCASTSWADGNNSNSDQQTIMSTFSRSYSIPKQYGMYKRHIVDLPYKKTYHCHDVEMIT